MERKGMPKIVGEPPFIKSAVAGRGKPMPFPKDRNWRDNLLVQRQSVIGRIEWSGPHKLWFCFGMVSDWDDTTLGSFMGKDEAREAVEDWADEYDA